MDINNSYRIERLTRENISNVEELFFTVYKRKAARNFFLNKYDTAYTGNFFMGFIAYSNTNIPIAFNGIIPCYIDYFGERVPAAQYTDVMTHPAYRLQGLFVDVSVACNKLCLSENIQFLFAFPNQNSYHAGVTKLGWKTIETMDCFTIPVKWSPIHNNISRIPVVKKILDIKKKNELNKYTTGDMGIKNNLAAEGFATVNRDKSYFDYKKYNRHYVIQAGSSKAWIK